MTRKFYLVVKEEDWEGGFKWGINWEGALYSSKEKAEEVAKFYGGEVIELEVDTDKWVLLCGWTEYED